MASVAPAACSFCAMPQAMERLLASPKTTAILPERSIMMGSFLHYPRGERADSASAFLGSHPCDRKTWKGWGTEIFRLGASEPSNRLSAAQVDQFHLANWPPKKTRPQPFEFFNRVGREATDLRGRREAMR